MDEAGCCCCTFVWVVTTIGGVGVGAGVPMGEPVPTEFNEMRPGELDVIPSHGAPIVMDPALGSPPILTDI